MDVFKEELFKAMDLSDDDTYEEALSIFNKLISAFPHEQQPYFERAMVLLNLDRDSDAISDFERLLSINDDYPGARDWYATALASTGKYLLAGETKLRELRKDKGESRGAVSPQKWADCAEYFHQSGDPHKARQVLDLYFAEYERKVDGYTKHITAPWRAYADILIELGSFELALQYAEKAIQNTHHVPADEFLWIRCLAYSGNYEKARSEFEARASNWQGTIPYVETKKVLDSLASS